MNFSWIIFGLFIMSELGESTLSKSDKKPKKTKKKKNVEEGDGGGLLEIKSGPLNISVHSRKLVNKLIKNPQEIIANHAAYSSATSDRNFDSMDILGYVTPWNGHGYDVVKTFGAKFTLISPVWLQVVPEGIDDYAIKGTHDIDKVKNYSHTCFWFRFTLELGKCRTSRQACAERTLCHA